jgi:hypothetical protein
MSEFKVTIILSLNAEKLLKTIDWESENTNLSIDSNSELTVIDMIRTGLITNGPDGTYQLTDVGEDILKQLK